MAKLQDKFFNRVIEGKLELENEDLKSLEDKVIVAKTLKQTEANYSLDLSEITFTSLPSGVEANIIYGRIEEINGVLFIVLAFTIKNNNESSASLTNFETKITLSEDIAKKIIDLNGYSVNSNNSNASITADFLFKGDSSYPSNLNRATKTTVISNYTTANQMVVSFFCAGDSISAGQTQKASFRTFLTIL